MQSDEVSKQQQKNVNNNNKNNDTNYNAAVTAPRCRYLRHKIEQAREKQVQSDEVSKQQQEV